MLWLVPLAQQSGPINTPDWGIAGGFLLALSAVGFLAWRLIRQQDRATDSFVKTAAYKISLLERENRICNRRVGMLVDVMRLNNMEVGDDIWTKPESEEPPVIWPN